MLAEFFLPMWRDDSPSPVNFVLYGLRDFFFAGPSISKYSKNESFLSDEVCPTFLTLVFFCVCLKVIAAEGEQKASRALKEASEVIAESSSALQLRYLQVQLWYLSL